MQKERISLKPREAGHYVFCRQCDMFVAKSEEFWCATEKSTQQDWQAPLFCRATMVLFCVCWFNYLNMWESRWNCAVATLLFGKMANLQAGNPFKFTSRDIKFSLLPRGIYLHLENEAFPSLQSHHFPQFTVALHNMKYSH